MRSHEVRRPPEAALEIRKRSLVGSRLWSLNNEPRHFGKAFFPGAFPFFMSVAVISRYPFLRTNPERGIMHYEKRSDGRSWLFFERIAQRVRRRLAIVRLDPQTREHVVERLDATDAELEVVRERARAIRMPEESRAGAMRISLVCEGETEAAYLGALSSALGMIGTKLLPLSSRRKSSSRRSSRLFIYDVLFVLACKGTAPVHRVRKVCPRNPLLPVAPFSVQTPRNNRPHYPVTLETAAAQSCQNCPT